MAVNKPLNSIEESDLQQLIDNQVSEGKIIEYKKALPGNSDGDKKGNYTGKVAKADKLRV